MIWFIWQYLGGTGSGPDTTSTTSGEVTVTPGGAGVIGTETTESIEASAAADVGPFVPDVIGLSRSAAIAALQAAGYRASVTDVYGTSKPAGTVFQQNPTAGARLEAGGAVGLLVQNRPGSTPTVAVPKLTGLSQSAAERKLEALGLDVVLSYFPDPGDPGRVHSQWPLAGDRVPEGGGVQIQVTVRP
jgi:serine/threonine-protein kinase